MPAAVDGPAAPVVLSAAALGGCMGHPSWLAPERFLPGASCWILLFQPQEDPVLQRPWSLCGVHDLGAQEVSVLIHGPFFDAWLMKKSFFLPFLERWNSLCRESRRKSCDK